MRRRGLGSGRVGVGGWLGEWKRVGGWGLGKGRGWRRELSSRVQTRCLQARPRPPTPLAPESRPVVPALARPEDPFGLQDRHPGTPARLEPPREAPLSLKGNHPYRGPRRAHRPWSRPGPGSATARPVRRSPPAPPGAGGGEGGAQRLRGSATARSAP